jgi:hypothetical protein
MKTMSQVLFWFGLACIPLSWVAWAVAPEVGDAVIGGVADAGLREAIDEARQERWGLFVGLWVPTALILSHILDRKAGQQD